jgi:murein L,D-transpeptidase YafK
VRLTLVRHLVWSFLLFLFVASCTPKPLPPVAEETPQVKVVNRVDHEISLPWGQEEPVLVTVNKTCQTLNVYNYGKLVRTFPVVLGRNPGRKLYQGDRRTPNGLYTIIDRDPHPRWWRFMLIDYPSEEDARRYQQGLSSGTIPGYKNGGPGLGGAVGIHGSDREAFNRVKINWTLGCISLLNSDLKEFEKMVSLGTLVYIHE